MTLLSRHEGAFKDYFRIIPRNHMAKQKLNFLFTIIVLCIFALSARATTTWTINSAALLSSFPEHTTATGGSFTDADSITYNGPYSLIVDQSATISSCTFSYNGQSVAINANTTINDIIGWQATGSIYGSISIGTPRGGPSTLILAPSALSLSSASPSLYSFLYSIDFFAAVGRHSIMRYPVTAVALDSITFNNADSVLRLDAANSSFPSGLGANRSFPNTIGVEAVFVINTPGGKLGGTAGPGYGKVEFPSHSPLLGIAAQLGALGNSLKEVSFGIGGNNDNLIEFGMQIDSTSPYQLFDLYTQSLQFNTSGGVIVPNVHLDDGGSINLSQNLDIAANYHSALLPLQGAIEGNDVTINLDRYQLHATSVAPGIFGGTAPSIPMSFDGVTTINTNFDTNLNPTSGISSGGDGGRFIIDAGSSININNMSIHFITNNATIAETSYMIFSGGGQISVPTTLATLGDADANGNTYTILAGEDAISFTPPAAGTIYWVYDATSYTISSLIHPVQQVPPPSQPPAPITPSTPNTPNTPSDPSTANIPASYIPYAPQTPTAPVVTLVFTDTSVLPPNNIVSAIQRLVPANVAGVATQEAGDSVIKNVSERVFALTADDAVNYIGISSGDEDKHHSGVWFSPFLQKARQKDVGMIYGYKITNYGGTLGGDRMLNDNFTLGVTWSLVDAKVKQTSSKVGDNAKITTNIISIYGLYHLPSRWFLKSILSGGQSDIKSEERRYRTDNSLGLADSKYKSYVYSINASLGKRLNIFSDIEFVPSLGFIYSKIKSDGYKETGDVPTLSVAKRSSYAIDTVLHGRLVGCYNYGNYMLRPELSASAQINLRRRNMKINYNSSFLEPVTLDVRESKRWYSLGAGLSISKGMMEYSINYEAQIDQKYMGRVGSLKIRLNF